MFSVGVWSNPWIWMGVGTMAVLQLLFVHAAAVNRLFHTQPVSLETWPFILAAGFGIDLAIGVEKGLLREASAA